MKAAGVDLYWFLLNLWDLLLPVHYLQLHEPFLSIQNRDWRWKDNNYPWCQSSPGDTNKIEVGYFLLKEIHKRRSDYLARRNK